MIAPLLRAFSLILLLGFAGTAMAADDLALLRITPTGDDVAATRQIVFEFNAPMATLGEAVPEQTGITFDPPVACEWRWLNRTALSCNLGEKGTLQPATTYKIRITPGLKSQDGKILPAAQDHTFTTTRPRAESAYLRQWAAPDKPVYHVSFNLYFKEEQNGTRYAALAKPDPEDKSKPEIVDGKPARAYWLVEPQAPLPANAQMILMQEPGLVSAAGRETGMVEGEIKRFFTHPAFAFRGVICADKNNAEILITKDTAKTGEILCNPMRPVYLSFSTPVLRSVVRDHLNITPTLGDPAVVWGDDGRDWSRLREERYSAEADYRIALPIGLKAAQSYTLSAAAPEKTLWQKIKSFFGFETAAPQTALADEFGRALPPFEFSFATGHRNPNYELPYKDAVLEKSIDSDVPVYVNNLTEFSFDYRTTESGGKTTPATKDIFVQDKQYAVPAGIRDMLDGKSGAVYAMLATKPAVEKWPGANRLFAQVTPFQIFAKLGHFESRAWVTDLATGAPVADAGLSVYTGKISEPDKKGKIFANVKTDESGVAILPGLKDLDPDLGFYRTYEDNKDRLFLRADKGGDMALLPVSYDYEVSLWNIANDLYANTAEKYGHMKAWGMTAQGIYRTGDTMEYKIYVRDQNNRRFIAPPDADYTLIITDPAGKEVYKGEKIRLNAFGSVSGSYKVPDNAAIGWYEFKLETALDVAGKPAPRTFYPLSVLVSDFTPAPFRVTTELNGERFKAGDKLDITTLAQLHSGGAYADAAVRQTITLTASYFSSSDPRAKGFAFDSFEEESDQEDIFQKETTLDDKGEAAQSLVLPEKSIVYGTLRVESAVRDDRGKSVAGSAQAFYAGVDRLVGLKQTSWVYESRKPATIQALVVDTDGTPVKNVPVDIRIEREEVASAKVKGAGNAYLKENTVTWEEVSACKLKSTLEESACTFTPERAGTYRAVATIEDTKGRAHSSRQYLWVTGGDYVAWNETQEYALTILPEKTTYAAGDTARYLVKNPYPGAYALVTVERYGVLDSFVQKLEGSAPVIEIPVKPDYIPGFYVSVVVMSPRVDSPPPEMGQVDLGKPAFRAGYVRTDARDDSKTIRVTAKPAQDVYRPRDEVKVTLQTQLPEGDAEPVELAVAVLDESVFDLLSKGRDAFDPYKGFYALESLDVANYSLLTRLIGRQKFEKKGANAGGDGGGDLGMRNLFKFVSYWNPSVPLAADGTAEISFSAPDNLTGWRVLALAVTRHEKMGLGEQTFKVNRPTELRPVMPNQVREGDSFSAGFSVMNRTDKARTIKVTLLAKGDLATESKTESEQTVTLEPYKRTTVYLPARAALLPATRDKAEGNITFSAMAGDESDSDAIEHTLPVLKSRTLETVASYASTTANAAVEKISVPADIYTDTGEIGVTLSPSLISGLDGAFLYMRDYPYTCWEQKLSRALMAMHYAALKPYLAKETVWPDADKIPQTILDMAAGHQAPNGGMAYFTPKDDYADPYLSAYTALGFSWLKAAGYDIPPSVAANLETYLLNFLRNDSAPSYYDPGMVASVRALILAAYKDTGKISADDVLRLRKEVKIMPLFGKAQYLAAAQNTPAGKETLNDILAAGIESSGKLSFNDTASESYERILSTPLRDNCAVLDALLNENALAADKAEQIVRFIIAGRGNRDHFENTQENIFCLNALSRYARAFEKDTPAINAIPLYNETPLGAASFASVQDKPVTLIHPLGEKDAGKENKITVTRDGTGRLHYNTRLTYAKKGERPAVNAGIDIRREYAVKRDGVWTPAKSPLTLKRGDLVRVDLYVSLPTARNFVVVNDPLPGGLETVNVDLATASQTDAQKAEEGRAFGDSRWSFYHRELRHDSARFYADWLEPGNYRLSYMAQAIATGEFDAPPVKAEEMYDPDIFGLGVKDELIVEDAP
jgi:alpha-2-macroglobulin